MSGGIRTQPLARSGRALGLMAGLLALGACLDRPIGQVAPITTNLFVDRITQTSVDKIDLLFMIDNSASMSDKQAILRLAVPDLVERLVNPVCVDDEGRRGETPAPGAPCPEGQTREFEAIRDINVAVVSSSLGDAGAQKVCTGLGGSRGGPDTIDLAHLMGSLPRGRDTGANAQGFLEWRAGETNEGTFSRNFENMVGSVGEEGCGWEASLESWYRFLVDPFPYRELVQVRCPGATSDRSINCVQPASDAAGEILLDDELLAQRRAFLRDDSLVAVIMLSDENDCSMQVGGQNWIVANPEIRMPRASTACDQNPNAACCYMCETQPPAGCDADPVCDVEIEPRVGEGRLALADDGLNLRCFDQKQRFGYDFLYPTARYVNALSQFELCPSRADLDPASCAENGRVPNPLFTGGRDKSLVFLGGIIGVPWQAIASNVDASGNPLADPDTTLRFKTAAELSLDDTWAQILGSPGAPGGSPPVLAKNPLMIESDVPRAGVEPGNPINGREFDTLESGTRQDLEYACIFPLPEPRNCADDTSGACDCAEGRFDKPLCEERPGETPAGTLQHWAKAYPGTRQLQVLHDYGQNSIVASICARNVDITTRDARPDFGYRPAVDSIVERLKERLGDRCLARGLLTAEDGSVPCTLVEAIPRPDTACACDEAAARRRPDASTAEYIRSQLESDPSKPCGADDPSCSRACLCEVLQVQEANENPDEALRACREDLETPSVEGWCYVADTELQHIGNPELVAECPAISRRILRFVGQRLAANSTTFVACQGSSIAAQGAD